MAQAITTQNQNVQLTKTFMVAFAGMLLAVPIVTLITASIVQAQFGSLVHAAQAPQTNSLLAGPSCDAPVDDPAVAGSQANTAGKGGVFGKVAKWLPFGQSNYSSTSTSTTTNTTTNTDNSKVIIKDNGNTDNRWSGNSSSFSLTDNRWSGNTTNTDFSNNSVNTNISDNGNTYTDNRNSGNTNVSNNGNTNIQDSGNTTNTTVNTDLSNNSVNNSGNTTNTDNSNNSVNNSGNTSVNVEVDAGLF